MIDVDGEIQSIDQDNHLNNAFIFFGRTKECCLTFLAIYCSRLARIAMADGELRKTDIGRIS